MLTKAVAVTLIAAVAVIALPRPTAYAGDKEWATAGKILAGVVGAAIIHKIATSDNSDRQVTVYRRTYSQPVRTVRYVRSPQRTWMPGHYEIRTERTWIEGYWEQVWVPALYKQIAVTHYDRHGRSYTTLEKVLVREGHYEKIWHDGYWETREVREWIPGHWEYR